MPETWVRAAEQVYNSYLLLYKLNELKLNNERLLYELLSDAIDQGNDKVKIDQQHTLQITLDQTCNSYRIKIQEEHITPRVKGILEYSDKDVLDLLANSELFFEKDAANKFAFWVKIGDEIRGEDLKIGGLGKKVPFIIRFVNFYKIIEILRQNHEISLQEKLRLANNSATGSGKTGDMALLKLWAYIADIPCITIVPSLELQTQSYDFDSKFLPSKVALMFAQPLYKEDVVTYADFALLKAADSNRSSSVFKVEDVKEAPSYFWRREYSYTGSKYATMLFTNIKNSIDWYVLNNLYGKNKKGNALICIDEAPQLKRDVISMARVIELSHHNPIAIFSANPDQQMSEALGIEQQILLSPKEREAYAIGKLPVIHYSEISSENILVEYIRKVENTHVKLNGWENAVDQFKKQSKDLSQSFLDCISRSLDSQVS